MTKSIFVNVFCKLNIKIIKLLYQGLWISIRLFYPGTSFVPYFETKMKYLQRKIGTAGILIPKFLQTYANYSFVLASFTQVDWLN